MESSASSARRSSSSAIGWGIAVGLALLALLTLPTYATTRMHAWPWWLALRGYILLSLAGLLGVFVRREGVTMARWPEGKLWTAVLLAFAGVQVLSAVMSERPRESFAAALSTLALVSTVVLLVDAFVRVERARRRAAQVTALGGVIFSVVSLALWLVISAIPAIQRNAALNAEFGAQVFHLHPHGFRNDQPLGHWNYTAGAALLALPWVLGAAIGATKAKRWLWLLGAAVVFAAIISTGSRGAIIGLAAGGGFAIVLAAGAARWSRRRMLMTMLGGVVLLGIMAIAIPRVRLSLTSLLQGERLNIGDQQRRAMLEIGVAMGEERWWIGQGPGLTTWEYPEYRHTVEGGTDVALQLHATPVQIWAETGLPGLALAALIVGFGLWFAWRGTLREAEMSRPATDRWMVPAAGCSFAAYAGFALTDYQLDLPVIWTGLAVNLAVVIAAGGAWGGVTQPGSVSPRGRRMVAAIVAGAICVLALAQTMPELWARRTFAQGVQALEERHDVEAFNRAVLSASTLEPENPHYFAGGASGHLRLSQVTNDRTTQGEHESQAVWLFERALEVEPDLEIAHFNLGWLLHEQDPARAVQHFRRAIWLLPDRAGSYLGLGLAQLEAGDTTRAIDALALEVVNDPAYLAAPAWDTAALAPLREPVLRTAIAISSDFKARAADPRQQADLAFIELLLRWMAGDNSVLAQLAAAAPESATEFFHALANSAEVPQAELITSQTPGWRVIQTVVAHPVQRRERLRQFVLARTGRTPTAPELDGLERLVERLGTDWRGWLTAPEGKNAPFVRVYRRDRRAYPILARNLDIPAAYDSYLIQENLIATWFFGPLFPARGTAPDALLLERIFGEVVSGE